MCCLLLQPVTETLENQLQLPADEWATTGWFRSVWFSPRNQAPTAPPVHEEADIQDGGAAGNYLRLVRNNPSRTAADHLACYIIMLRNCIDHSTSIGLPLLPNMGEDALELIAASPIMQPVVSIVKRFEAVLAYPAECPLDFERAEDAANLKMSWRRRSGQRGK